MTCVANRCGLSSLWAESARRGAGRLERSVQPGEGPIRVPVGPSEGGSTSRDVPEPLHPCLAREVKHDLHTRHCGCRPRDPEGGHLGIRKTGWANDAARSAREADHVHNLPSLLKSYSSKALWYCLDVERPCFVRVCTADEVKPFEHLWSELAGLLPPAESSAAGVTT
jgi:hypothetical protein